MVLSMVYQLWAGVRLVDAIAWQESWAHPSAFGFRPTRSALDGVAVTQVLLELCRLRQRALAGMSIDQVLRSHPPGGRAGRGIGAGHGLRHVPCPWGHVQAAPPGLQGLAGALRCWWRATNGILQGCPLSVILVNVLTTI